MLVDSPKPPRMTQSARHSSIHAAALRALGGEGILVTRIESVEFPYRDLARVRVTVGSLAREDAAATLDLAADVGVFPAIVEELVEAYG